MTKTNSNGHFDHFDGSSVNQLCIYNTQALIYVFYEESFESPKIHCFTFIKYLTKTNSNGHFDHFDGSSVN